MKKTHDIKKLDKNMALSGKITEKLQWHNPKQKPFRVSGLAWFETEKAWRRLPLKPKYPLRKELDALADFPTGAQLCFKTNSKTLAVRAELSGPMDNSHVTGINQCGFDCYIGPPGKKVFIGSTLFHYTKSKYEYTFFNSNDKRKMLDVTLNFPLYQSLVKFGVGLEKGAKILPPAPFDSGNRIIVYGTSLTNGGCAERPGMVHTNILSRWFNYEFINLGFSGNGKGDPEVAKIISEISNPGCFVLEYEGNCEEPGQLQKTLPEFVRILRNKHKKVPLVVISRPVSAKEYFKPDRRGDRIMRNKYQRDFVRNLRTNGDKNIYYIDGSKFLGKYTNEATIDGSHFTDLGFMMMSEKLRIFFRKIENKIKNV